MGLQIGRVDNHRLWNHRFGGKALHYAREDALGAPTLPPIVKCLRWPVFSGRNALLQAVAIDQDYAAQDPSIIDARLAMALGKKRLQPSHLRVRQPEKVAHDLSVVFAGQEDSAVIGDAQPHHAQVSQNPKSEEQHRVSTRLSTLISA